MRIQEEQIELQKKVERRICVKDISFLAARPSSYVIFCRFFRLLPPFCLLRFHVEKNIFATENRLGEGAGGACVYRPENHFMWII